MQRQSPPVAPDRTAEGEDVATVLDRVRKELVDLHAATIELQLCLGPTLTAAAAGGDRAILHAGQALDLVSQSLDGLATFAGAVSRCRLDSGQFDATAAAAQVKLDELASRLAGHASSSSSGRLQGDLELF